MRAIIAALSFLTLVLSIIIISFGSEVQIISGVGGELNLKVPSIILKEPSWRELKQFSEKIKESPNINDELRVSVDKYLTKAPLSPKAFYVKSVVVKQADFEKFLPTVRLDLEGELLLAELAKDLGKIQVTQQLFDQYLQASNGSWLSANKDFLKLLNSAPDVAPVCPEDPEIWTKELINLFSKDGEAKAVKLQKGCIAKWEAVDPMIAYKRYQTVALKLFPDLLPEAHPEFNQLLYTWAKSTGLPNSEYWKVRSNLQPLNLNFGMRIGDPLPELGSLSRWGIKGIKIQSQTDLVIGLYVPESEQVSLIEFSEPGILDNAKVYISSDNSNWTLYSSWKKEVAAPILAIDREALYFQSPLRGKYVKISIANNNIKDKWISFDALGE